MPKAYPYVRFSSDQQSEGDSKRRQLELAQRFCAYHKLDMQPPILDEGVSAANGNNLTNGKIGDFIALVRAGKIEKGSYLIYENQDRFSRGDALAALTLTNEIIGHGLLIATTADGVVMQAGDGWQRDLISHIKHALAKEETDKKSKRVREGWKGAKLRASAEHKALTMHCPAWLRIVDGKYEVIEERAAIVRRIFEETATMHGKIKIAQRLNDDKIPPFTPHFIRPRQKIKGWYHGYIQKLLDNRAVLGEFQSHHKNWDTEKKPKPEGDPVPNFYPQIVDYDLWDRSFAARRSRTNTGGPKTNQIMNLFSGLGTCWFCGSRIVIKATIDSRNRKRRTRQIRLRCENAFRKAGCTHSTPFRYPEIESAILSAMKAALFDDSEFQPDAKTQAIESEIAQLNDRIAKIDTRLTLILSDLDAEPDMQAAKLLRGRKVDDMHKLDMLKQELVQVRGKGSPLDHIQAVQALIADATGEDHPGRYEARARISQALRNIIDEIVFDDEARSIIVIAGNHTAGFRIDIEDDYSVKYLRRDTVMQLRTQAKGSKMEALIRRVG